MLSFLEALAKQNMSVHILSNYVPAIKVYFSMYGLNYAMLEDPRIRYFITSVRINRPLAIPKSNVMDIDVLKCLICLCNSIRMESVYKAVFLTGFFGFLRLPNLAPHSAATFDPSRHLTAGDVFFTKRFVRILLKWSKTMQDRDKCQILSLPKLKSPLLCSYRVLWNILKLYKSADCDPLFHIASASGFHVLIDSRIRKTLARLNIKMGFPANYFTFHTSRQSGATLAYNSNVSVQKIKHHGSWMLECVWRYISQDQSMDECVATSFAKILYDV